MSTLELDSRTSLEHLSIEMLNNNAEFRSCIERRMPELNDDIARTSEHLLVMVTNILEQANELGVPPIYVAFDAYLNGVDAKTLRARYAPLSPPPRRPEGPQGSP